jgi:hypothetical protein
MTRHVSKLRFSLDPLIEAARQRMRRRRLLVVAVLVLVGGAAAAGVIAGRSPSGMSGKQAAHVLRQELGSADRFVCSPTTGATPVGGEPDWAYLCLNATNPQRSGYFVLSNGGKIAKIEPAG